jgi:hypothetical protein
MSTKQGITGSGPVALGGEWSSTSNNGAIDRLLLVNKSSEIEVKDSLLRL